jgi:hypothetical protein
MKGKHFVVGSSSSMCGYARLSPCLRFEGHSMGQISERITIKRFRPDIGPSIQHCTLQPWLKRTIRAKEHRRSSRPDDDGESNEKAVENLEEVHQRETPSSQVVDSRSLWGTTTKIYRGLFEVIQANLLPITCVYLLTEGINFLSNRAFHRLTNECALTCFMAEFVS